MAIGHFLAFAGVFGPPAVVGIACRADHTLYRGYCEGMTQARIEQAIYNDQLSRGPLSMRARYTRGITTRIGQSDRGRFLIHRICLRRRVTRLAEAFLYIAFPGIRKTISVPSGEPDTTSLAPM
jgi:hypothetical protein